MAPPVDDHITNIINGIAKYTQLRKKLTVACLVIAGLSVLFFILYGIFNSNQAIQFVTDHKIDNKNLEKVMTNPRIKFEYKENEFYDIKANTATHKGGDDILLNNVVAEGENGNITAGSLLITDNGDRLFFSDKPVLVMKQVKTENDNSKEDKQPKI